MEDFNPEPELERVMSSPLERYEDCKMCTGDGWTLPKDHDKNIACPGNCWVIRVIDDINKEWENERRQFQVLGLKGWF